MLCFSYIIIIPDQLFVNVNSRTQLSTSVPIWYKQFAYFEADCWVLPCRLAASVGFYGLSINTNNLGGNRYVACFISGGMELLGNSLSYFGLKYIGGRLSFLAASAATALCLLATPALLFCKLKNVWICFQIGFALWCKFVKIFARDLKLQAMLENCI